MKNRWKEKIWCFHSSNIIKRSEIMLLKMRVRAEINNLKETLRIQKEEKAIFFSSSTWAELGYEME